MRPAPCRAARALGYHPDYNVAGLMLMPFLQAGGHRLEYRWFSPRGRPSEEQPVLVFLHEGLGSTALWKSFPDETCSATGCSVLVYSRYGHGDSDRLAEARGADYMHREALETLPEILSVLSIRSPILIGHSDGASIVLIHAGDGRWPVRGLVLLAPHVFVEDLTVASIAQAKVAFETGDLAARLGRYHADPESAFRGWNDIWLDPAFRRWNIEACLPGVSAPTLVIQGEHDQYGSMAQVEAITRQVRGPVQTVLLSGCAHSPHVDRKEATLQAVSSFVRAIAFAAPADR
jgi:pimeloyl-ACP methyl ester carboxylesterase